MEGERDHRFWIRRPDDFHLHVRDGAMMNFVVPFTAKVFGRCTIMPNTVPPITRVEQAEAYRKSILNVLNGAYPSFNPLMTLYLTDQTTVEMIRMAKASEHVIAFKLYPSGATTHSNRGVTDIWKLIRVFEAMAEEGMLLLVHGEVTDPKTDIFDREKEFIQQILKPLVERVPRLKVVMEHITTKEAVEFIKSASENVAASITPQHIVMNRNELFQTAPLLFAYIKKRRASFEFYDLLKKILDVGQAVLNAATSGHPRFFLGTDSAPHTVNAKESSCGCAGIFSAPVALSVYVEAFEEAGALENLEGFASIHGAQFYGFSPSEEKIEIFKDSWTVPDSYSFDKGHLVPLYAGKTLKWKVKL